MDNVQPRCFQFRRPSPHRFFKFFGMSVKSILISFDFQDVAQSCQQFFAVDRLWQQVSRTRLQSDQFCVGVRAARKNDHRRPAQRFIGPNGGKDLQPIDLRHMNIQQHKVRTVQPHHRQCLTCVICGDQILVATNLQVTPHNLNIEWFVIDNQYAGLLDVAFT